MTDTAAKSSERKRFWTDKRISLAVFLIIATVLGFEVARFTTSIHTRNKIDASAQVLELVKDCTAPPSAKLLARKHTPTCYERGQASTAGFLDILGQATRDANTVAVYCASHVPTGDVATIKTCVDGEFAKLHPPATVARK